MGELYSEKHNQVSEGSHHRDAKTNTLIAIAWKWWLVVQCQRGSREKVKRATQRMISLINICAEHACGIGQRTYKLHYNPLSSCHKNGGWRRSTKQCLHLRSGSPWLSQTYWQRHIWVKGVKQGKKNQRQTKCECSPGEELGARRQKLEQDQTLDVDGRRHSYCPVW